MMVRQIVLAFALSLSGLCGCSSAPQIQVASLVQKIEQDEVNAHQLRGQSLVVEGTLSEKDVDTSNALLLDGQAGTSISGQRKPPKRAATATISEAIGEKFYWVECTFSEFGADKLLRTSVGSHVAVRGTLDHWKRTEFETVPSLVNCTLQ